METFIRINGVKSIAEPKQETAYGKYGIDYNINIHKENDMYVFDTLRFSREDDYIRYRKLHG